MKNTTKLLSVLLLICSVFASACGNDAAQSQSDVGNTSAARRFEGPGEEENS